MVMNHPTLELRLLLLSRNHSGQEYLVDGCVVNKIPTFSAIDKARLDIRAWITRNQYSDKSKAFNLANRRDVWPPSSARERAGTGRSDIRRKGNVGK